MPRVLRVALLAFAAVVFITVTASPAEAHEAEMSAITISHDESSVTVDAWLPVDKLATALNLTELEAGSSLVEIYESEIVSYVEGHMSVTGATGESWDAMAVDEITVDEIEGVDTVVLVASVRAPSGVITDFSFDYDVIIEHLKTHSATLTVATEGEGAVLAATFDHATTTAAIDVDAVAVPFNKIARFGFDHVTSGVDHLLFLVVILLAAPVVVGQDLRWSETRTPGGTLCRVTKVASVFTVGHSLTLVAATVGWIEAPARLIEVLIAVSIAVGAIHAIRPLHRRGDTTLALTFGLVHGMAFAGILSHLELTQASLLTTLVAFNVGVELAQLAVIALAVPSLYLLSRGAAYVRIQQIGGSLALVASCGWLISRLGLGSNPIGAIDEASTSHLLTAAGLLAALAVALRLSPKIFHTTAHLRGTDS